MRIAITSLAGTPDALKAWIPTALVTVWSPKHPLAWPFMGPTLHLIMQDLETPRRIGPRHRPLPGGAIVAQSADILRLWSFMERHAMRHEPSHGASHYGAHEPPHAPHNGNHAGAHDGSHDQPHAAHDGGEPRLLIQCTAGLGRSPALAIVAAMILGDDAPMACCMVAHASPHASPNRLILRHAERLLEADIVSHAERSFTYRRGPAGAQGEPIAWAEVGGPIPTPVTGPPRGRITKRLDDRDNERPRSKNEVPHVVSERDGADATTA